jgi:hypothetical protein
MAISREEWERWAEFVTAEMALHVWPFITPISISVFQNSGAALGTGNYVRIWGADYLLTNHHVIAEGAGERLGHIPGSTNEYVEMVNHIESIEQPIDVALMRLGNDLDDSSKSCIPVTRFDDRFNPVYGELLFFLGFPNSRATRLQTILPAIHGIHTAFGGPMENVGYPILTQEFTAPMEPLKDFDPQYHTAVHLPAKAQKVAGGPDID